MAAAPTAAETLRILAAGGGHGHLIGRPASPAATPGEAPASPSAAPGKADEMLAFWRRVEGYEPKRFLVLDCGDAIGGASHTLESGVVIVEALNRLSFDALTPGNHEFDAGVEALKSWRRAAKFPFLAANLTRAGRPASDNAAPFAIYDEQGIKVGLIGLTNVNPVARRAGYLSLTESQSYRAEFLRGEFRSNSRPAFAGPKTLRE